MSARLTITEVAKFIGVTPRTIMRWEKVGKIKRTTRDWRGWRFYHKEDIEDIRKFYESGYDYDNERRGTVMDVTKTILAAVIAFAVSLSLAAVSSPAYAQGGSSRPGSPVDTRDSSSRAVTETASSVNIDLSQIPEVNAPSSTVAEASKYRLGPEDIIEVDVRKHPEFSGKYVVTAEGKIEYKFVGDILVEGLTKKELQERLQTIVAEFVIEPEVNVQILQYLSKVYYVLGEVNRPGKFYMKDNTTTVREALIQANLPNQGAATRKCRLITPNARGSNNITYVNVYELLYAGNLEQNLVMRPGDVLYIPSTVIAKVIQVIRPVTDTVSSAAGSAAAGAGLAAL